MSVAEGIAAIKATLEVAKLTSNLVNRPDIDVPQVREKLHEMLIHAVNAQMALVETQQEIADLHRRLEDKAELAVLRADMEPVDDGGFLVRKSEKAEGKFIAYCPVCWGDRNKAVALVPMASGYYSCAIHEHATYKTAAYRQQQSRRYASSTDNRPRPTGPNAWMG